MPSVAETTLGKQIFRMPQDDFTLEFPEPFFYVVKTLGRKFTDQELLAIDAANEDLRIETNADGDFEIMPPPFPETSRKNMAIDAQLWIWAIRTSKVFALNHQQNSPCQTVPNVCRMRRGY